MKVVWGKMQHGAGERLHAFRGESIKSLCGLISRFGVEDGRTTERPLATDACGHCKMRLREWPENPEVERLREALRLIQVTAFNLGGPWGLLTRITTGNLSHQIQHARSECREINRLASEVLGPGGDAWAKRLEEER